MKVGVIGISEEPQNPSMHDAATHGDKRRKVVHEQSPDKPNTDTSFDLRQSDKYKLQHSAQH
jgi:hypothetical protein